MMGKEWDKVLDRPSPYKRKKYHIDLPSSRMKLTLKDYRVIQFFQDLRKTMESSSIGVWLEDR